MIIFVDLVVTESVGVLSIYAAQYCGLWMKVGGAVLGWAMVVDDEKKA